MSNPIRIQDDLFSAVNQEWIDQAVIPDDKPRVGGFSDLDEQVEKLLISDFRRMASGELPYPDENVKKAVTLFSLAENMEKRNGEAIAPVLPHLNRLLSVTDMQSFNQALPTLAEMGYMLPFSIGVTANMHDSVHNCLMLTGPSTILPDTTFYQPGMEEQKNALLGIWSDMASKLLAQTDLPKEQQAQFIADALAFDARVATLVKSNEEWSEYVKCYNPMPLAEAEQALSPIALTDLTVALFGKAPEEVMVGEPRFLAGFTGLFNDETLVSYLHWAYIRELIGASSYLSEELREIGSIYSRALSGVQSNPSIEKSAYRLASKTYSEPVGLYYGRTYFGDAAKQDVIDMVRQIVETYKSRVAKNDILSPATKEKAILKLDKMELKIGYPDSCRALFDALVFDPNDSLFTAMQELNRIRTKDSFAKLYLDVDRTEWYMPGHMVNACYNPEANDITFPAAILQAPFYSIKQSRSENLGGIGAVIGHEISHAFDNNGAKCDENGNLVNWWTDEDFRKFDEKTQAMIRQFDGIELPQGRVNGAFIVSENIADNGGMAVTLEIMEHMEDADFCAYFQNWARVWCMKGRPEFLKLLLSIDVHGPAILRANMPPRNFPHWYDAFGVQSTDGMYLAPEDRVVIW